MSSRTTTYFLTATLALAAVTPGTVHAYRTTADTEGFDPERPVTWRQPVRWRVDPAGVSGIDAAIVERVVEDAWAALDGVSCARIAHERVVPGADTTHADGIVTIRGVQSGWESRGYPADSAGRTELVYQNSATGWSIADADVFLNAEHFVLVEEGGAASERALLPIVLHEMLHVVGSTAAVGSREPPSAPPTRNALEAPCTRSTRPPPSPRSGPTTQPVSAGSIRSTRAPCSRVMQASHVFWGPAWRFPAPAAQRTTAPLTRTVRPESARRSRARSAILARPPPTARTVSAKGDAVRPRARSPARSATTGSSATGGPAVRSWPSSAKLARPRQTAPPKSVSRVPERLRCAPERVAPGALATGHVWRSRERQSAVLRGPPLAR